MSHRSSIFRRLLFVVLMLPFWESCLSTSFAKPADPDWLFVSREERELVERAQRLANLHEFNEALQVARRSSELFPGGVQSQLVRVEVAEAANQLDLETEYFAREIEKRPTEAAVHLALAQCLYKSNNLSAAHEEAQIALGLSPDLVEAQFLEYKLAVQKLNPQMDPVRAFDQIHQKYPDYAPILVAEANRLFWNTRDRQSFQDLLEKMGRLQVSPPELFQLQDKVLARRRWYDPAEAVPLYSKAVSIDPSRVDLALERAERMRRSGRVDEAVVALKSIIDRAPRHAGARYALAGLLADLHKYHDACEILREGVPLVVYDHKYEMTARQLQAQYLYEDGLFDRAADLLRAIVTDKRNPRPEQARNQLVKILARRDNENIRVLGRILPVAQRGFYCGPASMSMIFQYWGRSLNQEAIASEVFTGIAGTAPEVLREFAARQGFESATFEGSTAKWKQLIDRGVPVLWLQMYAGWEGHYRVITGYDDIAKEFIVRDPNGGWERRVAYSNVEDQWLLPSLRQSVALAPRGSTNVDAISDLEPGARLRALSGLTYVITGANLFQGFWPALVMNACIAALLAIALAWMMNLSTCPELGKRAWWLIAFLTTSCVALNVAIYEWRSGPAVALLVSFHLGSAGLILLFTLCGVLRKFLHDWLRPVDSGLIVASVFSALTAVALIQDEKWQLRLVVAFSALLLCALILPRWRVARAIYRARFGPPADPVAVLGQYALGKSGFYSARIALVELCLKAGRYTDALLVQNELRRSRVKWPSEVRHFFTIVEGWAHVLAGGSLGATPLVAVGTVAERRRPRGVLGACARGVLGLSTVDMEGDHRLHAATAFARWKQWPRIPGVPRLGYGPTPHYLLQHLAEWLTPVAHKSASTATSQVLAENNTTNEVPLASPETVIS